MLKLVETLKRPWGNYRVWECQCECGSIVKKSRQTLYKYPAISCKVCSGASRIKEIKKTRKADGARDTEDLTGQQFGKLKVLALHEVVTQGQKVKKQMRVWRAICECGTVVLKTTHYLKTSIALCCGNKCWEHTGQEGEEKKKTRVGKQYGSMTVLEEIKKESNNWNLSTWWKCVCKCGTLHELTGYKLDYKAYYCKVCAKQNRPRGIKHPNYKGFQEISGSFWGRYKDSAKDRNLEFSITIEYAWSIFVAQNRKCALTGEELKFGQSAADKNGRNASIDRIDNTKGYIVGNIQWVTKEINKFKYGWPLPKFLEMCEAVANCRKASAASG